MKAMLGVLLAAALFVPAWASETNNRTAVPGTLNYVEGQASIGNQAVSTSSVGTADLQAGQQLTTQDGKSEILLTPGVYLRLGDNSSVRMISPDLTNTELAVNRGEAMVEVDEIHPENDITINQEGASTRLLKAGLYDFDASHDAVRVFSGKASVLAKDRKLTLKAGHELLLNTAGKLKSKGFDKKQYAENDDLYRWSSLRSDYLAEANVNTAQTYVMDGWYGPGWWGAGWYWSPWFDAYTFIPGNGFFYNPFGWGFYSPLWVGYAPAYGSGFYHHHFGTFRAEGTPYGGLRHGIVYGPGFHDGAVRSFGGSRFEGGFRGVSHTGPVHAMGGFHGFGGFDGGGFGGGRR
jgi:hypothetical protein